MKRELSIYKLKYWETLLLSLSLLILVPTTSFSQDHQNWSYNLNIYEVNVRQYTQSGTFAAFETHLERLKEMGVGILWFMPIHPIGKQNRLGSLGSYYSVKDYLAVNPEFGTMDEFKALVKKAHEMGMFVIIDWVANHTAWDNPLTITNPDWYSKDANGNFLPPPGTNWSDVIDLDYSKQGLRDYMIGAMKYWINETNIDGFRCDAVSWVPLDFWERANTELKNVKSGFFLLAEGDGPQYQNVGFDMTYAWGLHGFGNGVLKRIANRSSNVNELDNYVAGEKNRYSNEHYRMYFTSNHDENSWHGTVFEQFGNAAEAFAVLTSTLNGMPLVYSGQEAGLNKRLLFFDKDQIEWQQHPFADIYTTLLNLKKENKALWNGRYGGEFQRVKTTSDKAVFAFVREREDDKIFVMLNLSPGYMGGILLDTLFCGSYTDVFTNDTISFDQGSSIALPGWTYKVYKKRGEIMGISADDELAAEFVLSQNYPNPFNLNTKIQYYLPRTTRVEIAVYNCLGEKVKTLFSDYTVLGFHTISWDSKDETGENVSSGIYFYQIFAENRVIVKKMILLR
ncbi:MAG: T9SS type A sorting domain-containing protein [Bacteroidetes bacterium]|nr:T9SS type A sorting domain-containing protein [Bacteroidota bacterium]MBU1421847.1 T9SS type A sorting domain-containing protein [Bacteroidota bacterium]